MKTVFLKIGGSFITFKDKPVTLNHTALYSLVDILHRVLRDRISILAGNGGGSFAHYVVGKYMSTYSNLLLVKCHESTRLLNRIIVDYLVENKIPATSIQTSAFVYYDEEREYFEVFYKPIQILLENGVIPVVYGECIATRRGPLVISTEKVFELIAKYVKPERIVLLTDVDGIYTCNPKRCENPVLIERISSSNLDQVLGELKKYEKADITGSVYGKVLSMSNLARSLGIEIVILSGFNVKSVLDAIHGGYPSRATLITPT